MIYLVTLSPVDPATGSAVVLRYATEGYTTEPTDSPANVWFEPRVADPGNYDRHLFSAGRTSGESQVGAGVIRFVNPDGGLDGLLDFAFDGREVRIETLTDADAPYSSRVTAFVGTMEQATFPARAVEVRIRDRLSALKVPIQSAAYLGTTTSGGLSVAEGAADLKDVKKPLAWGKNLNLAPATVDQYDNIYQAGSNALSAITAVRDRGVALTATSDYATLAALKAASLTAGKYATCLASGLIRTYSRPAGTLTLDAIEGATLADRSAARIVQRMLAGKGTLAASDFDALHAAAPAECGVWVPPGEADLLTVATGLLASVGAYLTVDAVGVFRVGRLDLPSGAPVAVFNADNILDKGEAIARDATDDQGAGVPAKSVTVRYARNTTVQPGTDLDLTAATAAVRSFAAEEWRQEKAVSAGNATLYPSGPELIFETWLVDQSAAAAEASRRLAIYGARRDLFTVLVASEEAAGIDLDDVVMLRLDRFGMSLGRLFRVLGLTQTYATNTTTIELWG